MDWQPPRGRLQRALCEGLKKEEASFKRTLLTTIRAAELARRVIAGEFGSGDARRAALGSRYAEVQRRVNEMLS